MTASGLLAVGGGGLISGICWLLAAHVDNEPEHRTPQNQPALISLDRIAALATHGVVVGVALQLARTTSEYLSVVYDDPAGLVALSTLAIPGVVGGTGRVPRCPKGASQQTSRPSEQRCPTSGDRVSDGAFRCHVWQPGLRSTLTGAGRRHDQPAAVVVGVLVGFPGRYHGGGELHRARCATGRTGALGAHGGLERVDEPVTRHGLDGREPNRRLRHAAGNASRGSGDLTAQLGCQAARSVSGIRWAAPATLPEPCGPTRLGHDRVSSQSQVAGERSPEASLLRLSRNPAELNVTQVGSHARITTLLAGPTGRYLDRGVGVWQGQCPVFRIVAQSLALARTASVSGCSVPSARS